MTAMPRLNSRSGPTTGCNSEYSASARSVLELFITACESGETPAVEEYLELIDPADSRGAIELIYQEFIRREAGGARPDPSEFLGRFPRYRDGLERILRLHGECSSSMLGQWADLTSSADELPMVGDSIGPFCLTRELGSGSFARLSRRAVGSRESAGCGESHVETNPRALAPGAS